MCNTLSLLTKHNMHSAVYLFRLHYMVKNDGKPRNVSSFRCFVLGLVFLSVLLYTFYLCDFAVTIGLYKFTLLSNNFVKNFTALFSIWPVCHSPFVKCMLYRYKYILCMQSFGCSFTRSFLPPAQFMK